MPKKQIPKPPIQPNAKYAGASNLHIAVFCDKSYILGHSPAET